MLGRDTKNICGRIWREICIYTYCYIYVLRKARKTWTKVDFLPEKIRAVVLVSQPGPATTETLEGYYIAGAGRGGGGQAKYRPGSYIDNSNMYICSNDLCMQLFFCIRTYLRTSRIHIHKRHACLINAHGIYLYRNRNHTFYQTISIL